MKIISYYTDLYAWDAEQLLKSLARCGVSDYKVERRPRLGSWERNTQYKAPFILEKLLEGDPVVWTDADSRIKQYPALFDSLTCDVAFFYIKKYQVPEFKLPSNSILAQESIDRDGYLQSGTMFFSTTPPRPLSCSTSGLALTSKIMYNGTSGRCKVPLIRFQDYKLVDFHQNTAGSMVSALIYLGQ